MRFLLKQGLDPIVRINDGSNCDHNIDTSTVDGRRSAYNLLMSRGLFRIAMAVPVISVRNPYGCNDMSTLSMYRRPLPATNLRFLSTVMFVGRESSSQTGTKKSPTPRIQAICCLIWLTRQSMRQWPCAGGHASDTAASAGYVNFDTALRTAQAIDLGPGC